ncbi:MAG: 2-oxoacid:acceptor oxidoreductase subunit alpha [Candidatus Marinimicrobia bacterium]|nr:2-oxoacid:acceptor oxidoreductase subunit alpha [Candidatus Neomarinimicrobiota bacterium]
MNSERYDFSISIGGAAGQGIAAPGDVLAWTFVRRGLHLYTYNAYQSIIRGGHIFLTVRVSNEKIYSHGDKLDLLVCLNQDTMDRHLKHMGPGSWVIYNSDIIKTGEAQEGVQLCSVPVNELSNGSRNKLVQNTAALGVCMQILGLEFGILAEILTKQFMRKGQPVVDENVEIARAAYDHAVASFTPCPEATPEGVKPQAWWSGNEALAMGGASAGVKFYAAYPMSPSTGVLHWMATHARDLGIMVRQVEDEIGVATMAIGAAATGARAMCATSGGGFALMTEAVGSAGMMEIPVVMINVQRAGPSTGVPTKTEQGDLWQMLGASQGDFPRIIVAPKDALDAYNSVVELFNLVDRYQCPGIIISDLLISEGRFSVDPDDIDFHPEIDRGKLILEPSNNGDEYFRYKNTKSGISPRAVPGLEEYVHVMATDEQDEDGVLISDEFTNPVKRRMMVEKRGRKMDDIFEHVAAPEIEGPEDADITLVGWGSTYGVIHEAIEQLKIEGITANHLPIKWIVPFHAKEIKEVLSNSKKVIVVENNYSGQFYRYMRSETGLDVDTHIRKYDGEPFMPHQVVNGIQAIIAGDTEIFVPEHKIMV